MKKKVILQSIFITFIILITNLTALASLTSVWDGTTGNVPNGWYINSGIIPGTTGNDFHAGDGNATGNNLTINAGNTTIE